MAVLGKRKSRDGDSSGGVSALDAEAIFRRHFEAQFEPLDDDEAGPARTRREHDDDDDDDLDSDLEDNDGEEGDGDEWGGFSGAEEGGDDSEDDSEDNDDDDGDDDEAPAVQVIDHSKPQVPKEPKMSKKELKAFMSSKVIDPSAPKTSSTTTAAAAAASKPGATLPEDAPSLLAQDLELRRLLSESHLFTPSHNNAASASVFASSVVHGTPSAASKPFSEGRTRLKATELRLQALGAKKTQDQRMPMNMRKGVVAKAEAREAKRRREAKENGVILERSAGGGGKGGKGKMKSSRGRQERGVNGPGIGRMRGAELRISESDVRKIEGSRDAFSRRGRR